MPFKPITHRIHLGAAKTSKVAESIKQASSQPAAGQVKTASSKAANISNLGDFAHAKGKKKEEKKKAVEVESEETKATAATEIKVAEEKSDKGEEKYDAGKTEAKLVNDPEMPSDKDSKPMSGGDPAPKQKKVKTDEGEFPTSGHTEWEGKPENNNKPEMPTEENTKMSSVEAFKKVLALLSGRFTKFANMTPELKKRTREYLLSVFPEAYVNAMMGDK